MDVNFCRCFNLKTNLFRTEPFEIELFNGNGRNKLLAYNYRATETVAVSLCKFF